jgi:hypothetical protein
MLTTRIFVYHSAIELIEVPMSAFVCAGEIKMPKLPIRDVTEQQIAVNSNASVNASRIIEIFVTNPDAMHGQRQFPAFSFDSASLACPRVDSLKTIMNALSFGLTLSLAPEHWLADCK